jgi:hypothetical protein
MANGYSDFFAEWIHNFAPEDFTEKTDNLDGYRLIVNSDLSNIQLIVPGHAARKSVMIRNLGTGTIYVGKDSNISPTFNSFPLQIGEVIVIDHSTGDIYAVAASGAQQIAVLVE